MPKVHDIKGMADRLEALEKEMDTIEGTLGSLAKKVKALEEKKTK